MDVGFFRGVCYGIVASREVGFPKGVLMGQVYEIVARYVYNHPEHHHLLEIELAKRACKEAWPDLNKHVLVSR